MQTMKCDFNLQIWQSFLALKNIVAQLPKETEKSVSHIQLAGKLRNPSCYLD